MPFNGSGQYNAPASSWNPAVSSTQINPSDWNNLLNDISTALTTTITKDGQTTPTADLPMGGYKHTGVNTASARNQYAAASQVQDSSFTWCGTATGTADALVLTPSPSISAYAAGQRFSFKASASPNTTATTVAISGLTTKAIEFNNAALTAGVIVGSKYYDIEYDGTAFQLNRFSGLLIPASSITTTMIADGAVTAPKLGGGTIPAATGYSATDYNAGTKSTGTYTPDPANGNFQYAVNGGAHTLAPIAASGTLIVQYTNNGSAGAITTSGFTKVSGSFTTTNGDDFLCYITRLNSFTFLNIVALQ